MIDLVRELKKVMKDKNLSAEKASHFIGCSAKTVFRWLDNENPPNQASIRMIRNGIEKIKAAFPESTYELALKGRTLWRKVKHKLTVEERAELFDTNNSKGTEAYIEMLQGLVQKYQPNKAQLQMFRPVEDKNE